MKLLPWWVVAVAAAVSLGAAWVLKEPCIDTPWDDHFQYRDYCYSDVQALWTGKGLDRDVTQYVDQENEYPVLTGWFMQFAAFLTDDLHDYLYVSFLLLLLCGAATTVGLWRAGLPRELVLAWCLVPTLPIHGLTNWDLLAVVFAVWGWALWRTGHPLWSGLAFGLGGAAKLYPAFFLPFLFLAALKARDRRTASRVFLGGFLGLGVPNLIAAWMSFDGWFATWTFHAGRHPDFETPWQAFIEHFLRPIFPDYDWGTDWRHLVDRISMAVMVAVTVWLGTRVWNRRLDGLVAGGVFSLAFLLVNKVYSPQYTLWAVPLLLLLGAAWKPLMLFVTADFANFLVRYRLFTPPEGQTSGWNPAWDDWSLLAVNARWAFLMWATWTVVRRHGVERFGTRPPPPPAPGSTRGPEAKGQDTPLPEAFEA